MFYYIVAIIILVAILMYFLLEFIHLPNKIFKNTQNINAFFLYQFRIYLMSSFLQ